MPFCFNVLNFDKFSQKMVNLMTTTVQLITKHLIVQKYSGNVASNWYSQYVQLVENICGVIRFGARVYKEAYRIDTYGMYHRIVWFACKANLMLNIQSVLYVQIGHCKITPVQFVTALCH